MQVLTLPYLVVASLKTGSYMHPEMLAVMLFLACSLQPEVVGCLCRMAAVIAPSGRSFFEHLVFHALFWVYVCLHARKNSMDMAENRVAAMPDMGWRRVTRLLTWPKSASAVLRAQGRTSCELDVFGDP